MFTGLGVSAESLHSTAVRLRGGETALLLHPFACLPGSFLKILGPLWQAEGSRIPLMLLRYVGFLGKNGNMPELPEISPQA